MLYCKFAVKLPKQILKKTTTTKLLKNTFKRSLHFSLGIIVFSMIFFVSLGQSVNVFKRDVISTKNSSFVPNFVFQKNTDTPPAISNHKHNNNKRSSRNKSHVNNFLKKKDIKIQHANLFAGLIIFANQQNRTLSENNYYYFNFISSIFRPPNF